MYEIFEQLCAKHNVTPYRVCKDTGLTTATISNWKAGRYTPKSDKMQKIADYFGVSLEYLMTGQESSKEKSSELSARDERNIAKDLDDIMEKLTNGEDGPLNYNGVDLDDDTIALLRDAIDLGLRQIKIRNKEKYTPKKYKK